MELFCNKSLLTNKNLHGFFDFSIEIMVSIKSAICAVGISQDSLTLLEKDACNIQSKFFPSLRACCFFYANNFLLNFSHCSFL